MSQAAWLHTADNQPEFFIHLDIKRGKSTTWKGSCAPSSSKRGHLYWLSWRSCCKCGWLCLQNKQVKSWVPEHSDSPFPVLYCVAAALPVASELSNLSSPGTAGEAWQDFPHCRSVQASSRSRNTCVLCAGAFAGLCPVQVGRLAPETPRPCARWRLSSGSFGMR